MWYYNSYILIITLHVYLIIGGLTMNLRTKKLTLALLVALVATQPAQAMNWKKAAIGVTAYIAFLTGVAFLLGSGTSYLHSRYVNKNRPFLDAIRANNTTKVAELLNEDPKIDIDCSIVGMAGQTPLMIALFGNQNDLAKLLVERGADVNAESIMVDERPLYIAIENKNSEMVEYLFKKGATLYDDEKDSLLHAIIKLWQNKNNALECLPLLKDLLDNGADINAENAHNQTPIAYCQNADIKNFLQEYKDRYKTQFQNIAWLMQKNKNTCDLRANFVKGPLN